MTQTENRGKNENRRDDCMYLFTCTLRVTSKGIPRTAIKLQSCPFAKVRLYLFQNLYTDLVHILFNNLRHHRKKTLMQILSLKRGMPEQDLSTYRTAHLEEPCPLLQNLWNTCTCTTLANSHIKLTIIVITNKYELKIEVNFKFSLTFNHTLCLHPVWYSTGML